ncbi:WecB/TagA/CpsF family glycosyltransferase [Candidatus Daviesbacteria bacterium]|nr:WecB/TagA/CpsF family glycosyltransferase [Candidatus Daviesbacteria bacterium]
MRKEVLGVKIDDLKIDEALSIVEKWIWNPGKHYVVTPNPEFLVAAQKDSVFKSILNKADLSIPDGIGLKISGKVKNTFSGTDFMEELIKLSSEKGFTVGFLGGRGEVAKKSAECLMKKYPKLKVGFAESGGEVQAELPGVLSARSIIRNIPALDILFVAFGHIKQEKWIANNLNNLPVHIVMGVGGAFDYLSGSVSRAPKWIRNLGFEWLFRLIIQPWRVKRQLALIKYLFMLIWNNDNS